MGMFCFQCQETAGNKGCTLRGVCGKTEDVAKRMDLLLYVLKGISTIVVNDKLDVKKLEELMADYAKVPVTTTPYVDDAGKTYDNFLFFLIDFLTY